VDTVWACIVCWRAPAAQVQAMVEVLRPQVAQLVLVDNGRDPHIEALADRSVRYVPMPANLGTGAAMNRAWELALAAGAGALIAFDQDSVPLPDLVARLSSTLQALQRRGDVRVAGVGPAKADPRTGLAGRLLLPVRFRRRHLPGTAPGPVEVDHLITSGCLIPAGSYREAGPYDEDLFLDYVDIDWCRRARTRGLRCFVDTSAVLSHRIGDSVFEFGERVLSIHQPMRNYLLVRNHLLLWRKKEIPRLWLASDLLQVLKKMGATLLLAAPRLKRLRWIRRGVRDGLAGRGGPPPAR
jgi:rhamnosyltransferase